MTSNGNSDHVLLQVAPSPACSLRSLSAIRLANCIVETGDLFCMYCCYLQQEPASTHLFAMQQPCPACPGVPATV